MNRRSFIQTAFGSALAFVGLKARALGDLSQWSNSEDIDETSDVKDLVLWAPFEAFLPEQSNPHLSNPHDGTQTGVLKAADIIKGEPLTLKFWHEHGGQYHKFTITAEDFTSLKSGNPVVIYEHTTIVQDHYHFVVIDPKKVA